MFAVRRLSWWQIVAISSCWAALLFVAAQAVVNQVAHPEWIMVKPNHGVFTYSKQAMRRVVGVWITALVLWIGGTFVMIKARFARTAP